MISYVMDPYGVAHPVVVSSRLVDTERLTVPATVVGLTPPNVATECIVQVQTAAVRMTTDGTEPTTTLGWVWAVGDVFRLTGQESMKAARFTRDDAADGALEVVYSLTETIEVKPW